MRENLCGQTTIRRSLEQRPEAFSHRILGLARLFLLQKSSYRLKIMKARLSIALTALMTLGITATPAANFDEQDIEQTQVVAIARPYGGN